MSSITRTAKYYWMKRVNIAIGILLSIAFPTLTYLWLSGHLYVDGGQSAQSLQDWSLPGNLSAPIALSVVAFIVGAIILLFVLLRCDIDDVLPEKK